MKSHPTLQKTISIVLGLVILVLGSRALGVSLEEVLEHFKQIRLDYVILIIIMAFGNMYLIITRWAIMVRTALPEAPFPDGFFLLTSLASSFSSLFMPNASGNIGIKTLSVKTIGKTTWEVALGIVILDQMLNLIVTLLMTLPCLVLILDLKPRNDYLMASILILSAVLFLLLHFRSHYVPWFIQVAKTMHHMINHISTRMGQILARKNALEMIRFFASHQKLNLLFLYSFIIYFFAIARYYFIAISVGAEIPFHLFLLSYPIIYYTVNLSPTPSGLGFQEVGWVAVLMLHGVDQNVAMSFAVIFRIIENVSLLLMSGLGYGYFLYTGLSIHALCSNTVTTEENKNPVP